MKIYNVNDKEFEPYGSVLEGYDFAELFEKMKEITCPDEGIEYVASVKNLEDCKIFEEFMNRGFGGSQIQVGYVAGKNNRLNCLEYHKSIEFNIAKDDIILLLGKRNQIENGKYNTDFVKAFLVPAGTGVELFDTTLHYAPCGVDAQKYRVACVLPKGTNGAIPKLEKKTAEDAMCYGKNKWLIAHIQSKEALNGAYVGITGENLVAGIAKDF